MSFIMRYASLIMLLFLIIPLILSGVLLGLNLKNEHQILHLFFQDIGLRAQTLLTTLSSIINTIARSIWPFNELENLHFNNEDDIHKNSNIFEENDYKHNWALAIILHTLHVLYPMRSGNEARSVRLRHAYRIFGPYHGPSKENGAKFYSGSIILCSHFWKDLKSWPKKVVR